MACNRCKQTSSDPFNFLLSCSECGKNWHHRCHIPPLAEPELIALLSATTEDDVDNGLSSWIGRCCKRKRVRAEAMPEVPVDSAPSAPLRQPRSLSVSADPEIVVHDGGPPRKAAPLNGPDLEQTTAGSTVVASPKPGDEGVHGDLGFHKPVGSGGPQTISVQPAVRRVGVRGSTELIQSDRAFPTLPPHSTPPPTLSAGPAPPSSHNQQPTSFFSQFARPPQLRESSTTLERESESSSLLAGATRVQALSRLSNRPISSVGGIGNVSTKSTSMDIDPPTLDLRALALNRATRANKAPSRLPLYRTTESGPPSPSLPAPLPPSVKLEDREMEDLYGPTREPQRRRRSLSPQLPSESEPRVLPALAAKDPHVLAVLERQELREAARPRRGRRKSQPVQGAGKKRAGFVLVEGLTARADQKSRWGISRK